MQVWREAYAGQMPAAYVAGLREEDRAARWRRLQDPEPRYAEATTLVARAADDRILGFASAGPSWDEEDEDGPTACKPYVINLLARAHGTELADELMSRLLEDREASPPVAEGSARARACYARHGFMADGGKAVHEPTKTPETRMVRRWQAGGRWSATGSGAAPI